MESLKRNENCSRKEQEEFPDEIILDILSYLPLKDLHRFKFVNRKLWNTLLLHPDWIIRILSFSSHIPHIQQFEIPSPPTPYLCIGMDFVPSIQAVKLLSVVVVVHQHDHSLIKLFMLGVMEILIIVGKVLTCLINVPKIARGRKFRFFWGEGRSVAYCISQDDDDIDVDTEVDILDMENDGYIGHTTFPKGFSTTVNLLDWNGHLSFAEIVKDELHVLVLQDYKRLKWAQTKQIIRLMPSFLQRIDVTDTAVCVHKYLLFFVRRNKIDGGTQVNNKTTTQQ
ncbi:hypothetical protein P3S68_009159 [Capsicum galapagoense]